MSPCDICGQRYVCEKWCIYSNECEGESCYSDYDNSYSEFFQDKSDVSSLLKRLEKNKIIHEFCNVKFCCGRRNNKKDHKCCCYFSEITENKHIFEKNHGENDNEKTCISCNITFTNYQKVDKTSELYNFITYCPNHYVDNKIKKFEEEISDYNKQIESLRKKILKIEEEKKVFEEKKKLITKIQKKRTKNLKKRIKKRNRSKSFEKSFEIVN